MRSTSIDALRGIAILGILFMNIPFHANMLLGYVPFESMLSSDKLITLLYSIFADGRLEPFFVYCLALDWQFNMNPAFGRESIPRFS